MIQLTWASNFFQNSLNAFCVTVFFYPTTFNDFKSIFRRSIKKYIHQCLLSYKSHVILNFAIACSTAFLHSQIKRRMVKRENIHSVYTLRPIVLNVVLTLIIWSEGLVNENRLKSISCFLRRGNLPIRKLMIISYYLYLYSHGASFSIFMLLALWNRNIFIPDMTYR